MIWRSRDAESGSSVQRKESSRSRGIECGDPAHKGAVAGGDPEAAAVGREEGVTPFSLILFCQVAGYLNFAYALFSIV